MLFSYALGRWAWVEMAGCANQDKRCAAEFDRGKPCGSDWGQMESERDVQECDANHAEQDSCC